MKKHLFWILLYPVLISVVSCIHEDKNFQDTLTFIVAADMRYHSTEQFRTSNYFLGALEAIQKVGKGEFIIIPGDLDPPNATKDLISQILGTDYPLYPVVGNHELDSLQYMAWLRQHNKDGTSLPRIVNQGPPGCEETTYSFEWENSHFVILNQYYDGKSDTATDGDIVPELLAWLERDLVTNAKKHIFVFGHEPLIAIPDMDNGRIRHQGNSLDQYPKNAFDFHQLLLKYNVTAYICGHTHNTSLSKINGLWQIDAGHARGIESDLPSKLFALLSRAIDEGLNQGLNREQSIAKIYEDNKNRIDKDLTKMALGEGPTVPALLEFYSGWGMGGAEQEQYFEAFRENTKLTRSTFLKIYAGKAKVKVEMYRDDGQGGLYSLNRAVILD